MLIPQTEFIGLEKLTHLATGGESPALNGGTVALQRMSR